MHVLGVRGSTVTHLDSEVSNLGKLCQLTDQTQSYFPTRHAGGSAAPSPPALSNPASSQFRPVR